MLNWLLLIAAGLLWAGLWWEIFRKAGCPGCYGLLMAVPVINFVVLIAMVMMDWPVQRELSRLRLRLGEATPDDATRVLSEATQLEQRGDWNEAIALYQLVIEKSGVCELADTATRLAHGVREKQNAA